MASIADGYGSKRLVLALGMFDGMHLGHREILNAARRIANERGSYVVATTFSDRIAETGWKAKGLLYTAEGRVALLRANGADFTVVLPADAWFLDQSPAAFLKWLNGRFDPVAVVMGEDFRFGKNGAGDTNFAARMLNSYGIDSIVVPLKLADGQKISTSEIKSLLASGRIEAANALLGHVYSVDGNVVTGRREGAKNGVPTANFEENPALTPIGEGVYKTLTQVGEREYLSITNIGAHPTFGDLNRNIETFLLDFEGNLYGETITVRFLKRLRDIQKFGTEAELYRQIRSDVEEVRK